MIGDLSFLTENWAPQLSFLFYLYILLYTAVHCNINRGQLLGLRRGMAGLEFLVPSSVRGSDWDLPGGHCRACTSQTGPLLGTHGRPRAAWWTSEQPHQRLIPALAKPGSLPCAWEWLSSRPWWIRTRCAAGLESLTHTGLSSPCLGGRTHPPWKPAGPARSQLTRSRRDSFMR